MRNGLNPFFLYFNRYMCYNMCIGGEIMSKSNMYYLVARNRKNNSFEIVDFNGKLENIDIYTTKFKNEKELSEKLLSEGKITSNDVDLYIVVPKKDGIIANEVLYSDSKDAALLAKDSLNKELGFDNINVDELLTIFCTRMMNLSGFYDMIVYGKSNVYSKFANYFSGRRFISCHDVKYADGGWANSSYHLLRNIMEAYSRYTSGIDHTDDIVYRKRIENILQGRLYKNENAQMSLFDMIQFKEDNIESDDKLIEIMNVLENVSSEDFKMQGRIKINFVGNEKYGRDLVKLRTLLGDKLTTMVGLYAMHRDGYEGLSIKDDKYFYYADLIKDDQTNIVEALTSDKDLLDRAYEWALIYSKYNSKGDEYGYQRRKKDTGIR